MSEQIRSIIVCSEETCTDETTLTLEIPAVMGVKRQDIGWETPQALARMKDLEVGGNYVRCQIRRNLISEMHSVHIHGTDTSSASRKDARTTSIEAIEGTIDHLTIHQVSQRHKYISV